MPFFRLECPLLFLFSYSGNFYHMWMLALSKYHLSTYKDDYMILTFNLLNWSLKLIGLLM